MKCINSRFYKSICFCFLMSFLLSACERIKYDFAFGSNQDVSSFTICDHFTEMKADSFAKELCVIENDNKNFALDDAGSFGLFDVQNTDTIASKNANQRMHPASLTKVMTAIIALKEGTMDQVLTATENVNITEAGAQLSGIKKGDSMTLDQALHLLLINSSNDVAIMIAEGIAGSVPQFVEMMNAEALRIGATNSCFVNPHGLTEEGHYSTAYDMYLIFNEAMKYKDFLQIMNMDSYETVYHDAKGNDKSISVKTTNLYLKNEVDVPENITVIGGKTGTTNAAGHCLILLSKDISGNSYISVILREPNKNKLYEDMFLLLNQI